MSQKKSGRRGALGAAVLVIGLLAGAGLVFGSLWKLPFSTATKDHSPPPVLLDLRNLADYHAAQAQFEVVIDEESDVKWVPQAIAGERVQFVAVGTVDAVVDFSSLPADAVTVSADGSAASIRLPRPTIAEAVLDLEQSHVMNRDRGLVNRVGGMFTDNPTSERDLMRTAASKMGDAAAETDLVGTAQVSTERMLRTMLLGLGFERVDVRFGDAAAGDPSAE
jgi:Protein of unknown function (DUF4230)